MADQHPTQRAIAYIESQSTGTMAVGLLKSLQDLVREAKTNSKTMPITLDEAINTANKVIKDAGDVPYVCIDKSVLNALSEAAWRYNALD